MWMEMYRVLIWNMVFCRAIASMGPSDNMDVKSKCECRNEKIDLNFDFSHTVHEKPILFMLSKWVVALRLSVYSKDQLLSTLSLE